MKVSLLCRLSVALLLVSPAFAQTPSFKARRDVATGTHPVGTIAADFDSDGLPDIVSVDQFDDSLSLIKGFGDGTFRRIRTVAVGSLPSALAFADANGDGLADLIAANLRSQEITVNLNDGHGGFGARIGTPFAGTTAGALAVGDWNGDGRLDAAVVAGSANTLVAAVGDGAGHFGSPVQYSVGINPKGMVAGDFNRDGKPDLAVADSFSDTLTILLNQTAPGDPLQWVSVIGGQRSVFRWGTVAGALYDVIRGSVRSIIPLSGHVDLGPVACLADDLAETDTAGSLDESNPDVRQAFFYLVRPVIGGVPGDYTISTGGKVGIPSSGGCD